MTHPINMVSVPSDLAPSKKAALLSILTAASIATNYLLVGIVNVKLMDLLVFTSGYVFGMRFGATVAILSWIVYGTLNPYGFSFPILLATITGEMIYGLCGGYIRKFIKIPETNGWKPDVRFAVLGFLLSFCYDVYTNIVSALVAGVPLMVAMVAGIPFALLHEVSNAAFFMFGLPPLTIAINHVLRRY